MQGDTSVRVEEPQKRHPLGRTIADLPLTRENNFNLLRSLLAFMVLIHHSIVLTVGDRIPAGLSDQVIGSFGVVGVDGFFIISGFLVTRSITRQPSLRHFILARVFRIYPGLWAMLAATLVLALAFGTLPAGELMSNSATWRYFAGHATAVVNPYLIPGLFETNRFPAVNGSLWSLRWELLCYGALVTLAVLRVLRFRWLFPAFIGLCAISFLAFDTLPYSVDLARRLGLAFAVGGAAFLYAGNLRLGPVLGVPLIAGAVLSSGSVIGPPLLTFAFAYCLLWIALVPKGLVLAYNRLPDVSYGLYIYAFPIQQQLIAADAGTTPAANLVLAFPITLIFAIASWYLVEKPSLALKDKFLARQQHRPTAAS